MTGEGIGDDDAILEGAAGGTVEAVFVIPVAAMTGGPPDACIFTGGGAEAAIIPGLALSCESVRWTFTFTAGGGAEGSIIGATGGGPTTGFISTGGGPVVTLIPAFMFVGGPVSFLMVFTATGGRTEKAAATGGRPAATFIPACITSFVAAGGPREKALAGAGMAVVGMLLETAVGGPIARESLATGEGGPVVKAGTVLVGGTFMELCIAMGAEKSFAAGGGMLVAAVTGGPAEKAFVGGATPYIPPTDDGPTLEATLVAVGGILEAAVA